MISIIKVGGHQAIVKEGDIIEIDKLPDDQGTTVQFEALLVTEEDGSSFQIGTPVLSNIFVEAEVVKHDRGDKVLIFKMKRRKRYRRTKGHRQDFTVVKITKIGEGTRKAPVAKKVVSETSGEAKPKKSVVAKKESSTSEKAPAKKVVRAKKVEKSEE